MRMRHHSPDFGESECVWMHSLYNFTEAFKINIILKMLRVHMQCQAFIPPPPVVDMTYDLLGEGGPLVVCETSVH